MKDESRRYLFDILVSCQRIVKLTGGLSYEEYVDHASIPWAVERLLEHIGIAVNRLKSTEPAVLAVLSADVRGIIGTRNFLAHNYDDVDSPTIYSIATRHIPALLAEMHDILQSSDAGD